MAGNSALRLECRRIDFRAQWEETPATIDITLDVAVARKIKRAAVVADAGWIRASMHLARLFTKAEIEAFHVNELEQARAWINARKSSEADRMGQRPARSSRSPNS